MLVWGFAAEASAQREWVDKSGRYVVNGSLLAFNDHLVILKTADGELLSMAVSDLSDETRDFLKSEEANSVLGSSALQKWTLRNGLQIIGQVVSHEVRDVTLQRRRGKLYVNDRPVESLPAEYRRMLPVVVGHFENQDFDDLASMEKWFNARHGYRPVNYHCEGIKLALENGEEYLVPYFVFADSDRKFLEAGGEEARKAEAYSEDRQKQDLYTQVRAAEYQRAQQQQQEEQRLRERQEDQQIKMVQLGLLAVAAGATDLWEVAMVPPGGSIYQAQLVVVPARNSLQASELASAKWPGYQVGSIRRVNRNFR